MIIPLIVFMVKANKKFKKDPKIKLIQQRITQHNVEAINDIALEQSYIITTSNNIIRT